MDISEIIGKIKEELTSISGEVESNGLIGSAQWTRLIKQKLFLLGKKYNYEVCASSTENAHREWLFDLVWFEEQMDNGLSVMTSLPLVVESEWSLDPNEIIYDFQKLLVANADLKVMIYHTKNENPDDLIPYFKKAVQSYKHTVAGDKYLIAILNYYDLSFNFNEITKE